MEFLSVLMEVKPESKNAELQRNIPSATFNSSAARFSLTSFDIVFCAESSLFIVFTCVTGLVWNLIGESVSPLFTTANDSLIICIDQRIESTDACLHSTELCRT